MQAKLISLVLCTAIFLGFSIPASAIQSKSSSPPIELKVQGNQVIDTTGKPVLLRGVNAASLEWSSDGEGHILETIRVSIDDWNSNVIRIPLSQDRWFGKGPEQKDGGVAYRALVKKTVDLCSAKGVYIILDLHWNDVNQWGQNIGQHSMLDRNSVIFWKDCAAAYANNPAVIFDLYNEPHDTTWDVWLNGGTIKDRPNTPEEPVITFEAVGMQEMLDTVRSTGAKNVVIAGGLSFSYDLDGVLEGRQLKDPNGNGVIYANHAYDYFGESIFTWIENMKKASAKFPIIIGEFGWSGGPNRKKEWWGNNPSSALNDDWLLHLILALHENNWAFTAWDMHPAAGPSLIADWNYMPTKDFGVYVQDLLVNGKAPDYTPPDISKINELPKSALPESARIGDSNLYGDWQIKGPYNAILSFASDKEGKIIGQWINSKQLTHLQDVRYKDGNLSFIQPAQSRKEIINGFFTGKIEDNKISGNILCAGNKSNIEGFRKPKKSDAAPAEANQTGSKLVGNWILTSPVKWGSPEQRLTVYPDMTGLYGVTPVKVSIEGNNVTIKVPSGKYPQIFELTLDDNKLTGVVKTSRDSYKVTGKKI